MQNISMCGRSFIRLKAEIPGLARLALPIFLCFPIAANTGCTRTSDGTIVLVEPSPSAGSKRPWWKRSGPESPAYPPQPGSASPTQPTRTQTASRPAPRSSGPVHQSSKAGKAAQQFQGMRVGVRPPFTPSESGKPLNCANKTQPGGRVKVVCE